MTALALVAGLFVLTPAGATTPAAAAGTDDYPSRLRSAAQDSLADPWLFYNRECTSFVAWRLNHDAGVPFHNYFLGVHWGNASNWKYAASRVGVPVDSSAEVGSVAWWAAGSAGSSRGHVAWVRARTKSSITIEEYNYLSAGHYDQRTISTGSRSWPSAFLHVGELALRNTAAPSIPGGTPQVGSKLSARSGSWSLSGATYTYRWLADGVRVGAATHRSFAPRSAQLGKRLQVQVTATVKDTEPVTVTSARTHAVTAGDLVMTGRPKVSGTAKVGVRLTATPGAWSPSGASYHYQWLASGVPVQNATRRRFTPHAAQLGRRIQVQVTASATGMDSGTSSSARTPGVEPGKLTASAQPTITGTPQVDSQLSATTGTWSPSANYAYQWSAAGDPVAGAVSSTFTPTATQLGQRITVTVTASRGGYTTASSRSRLSAAVAPATFAKTGPPIVSGTPQVDKPLTVSPGVWSPAGTPSYRWFVDGVRVSGATRSTFTPRTGDLRRLVTVRVTMTRPGYRTASSTSAATAAVLPGTFQNSRDPAISGTPRVGRPLTIDPGGWSPTPTLRYQWYADAVAIPGATTTSFTPTAAELGKRLTVTVTARRGGYLTALIESAPTAKIAPGTITSVERPAIAGSPVVGARLRASRGAWTIKPSSVGYQWYADGSAIAGATGSSYRLTSSVLDQRVSVHVTVSADGYDTARRSSTATKPVVLGQVGFRSTPTMSGTPWVGRLLRAHAGSFTPSSTTAAYTWLRSGVPIKRASGHTYRLSAADVGHRITVRVTLSAPHWASRTARTGGTARVRAVPEFGVRSSVAGHRVKLRITVQAPGIAHPGGRVVVTEHGARIGTVVVSNGHGRLWLYRVPLGTHHYRLSYTGPLQTRVVQGIDVTLP